MTLLKTVKNKIAMSEKKQALQVAALENGTVIDHIPSDKLFTVVSLLRLQNSDLNITIGNNLPSKKLGKKGIIKVADRYFTDEEINQLSVVASNIRLNIIEDYEVVEKKEVQLPDELMGIVRCNNPKCITNNEPMKTHFHVVDKENGILKCHYCEKEQNKDSIKTI
jgi:aspartate carbamoyltransferase regulatory subunit